MSHYKDSDNKFSNSAFKAHLELKDNHRIIFSSKYGKGKTTFLRNFFKDPDQQKKYIVLHLFPVNYSVAENKDIFELIKYDIICELARQELISLDTKDESIEKKIRFLHKNFPDAFKALMIGISCVNPYINIPTELISELYKTGEEILKDFKNSSKSNEKILQDSLEDLGNTVGFLYEHNLISKLIEQQICKAKTKEGIEEIVLILDDLDRLDPDHIFRILNIFSAHCDETHYQRKNEFKTNKFNFDKVIFVCDAQNIRSIFEHRFGPKADFEGYFDKFYSKEQYNFDSKQEIKNWFNEYMEKQIKSLEDGFEDVDIGEVYQNVFSKPKIKILLFKDFIIPISKFILEILIDTNQVNFRNILQVKTFNFQDPEKNPIKIILDFLISIVGSPEYLYKIFSDWKFQSYFNWKFRDLRNSQNRIEDLQRLFFHLLVSCSFKQFNPITSSFDSVVIVFNENKQTQEMKLSLPFSEKIFKSPNGDHKFNYASTTNPMILDNEDFAALIQNVIKNIYLREVKHEDSYENPIQKSIY